MGVRIDDGHRSDVASVLGVVLIIEVDARLGSGASLHVGPGSHPDLQKSSGGLFHEVLTEAGLEIPAIVLSSTWRMPDVAAID